MMGTDLVVEEAIFVGLNIGLEICVAPGFFQGDVYAALWKKLVTGDSCAGKSGFLNAANFRVWADGVCESHCGRSTGGHRGCGSQAHDIRAHGFTHARPAKRLPPS